MGFFAALSLLAIVVMPFLLIWKRQMNVSLILFYVLLCLGAVGDFMGGSTIAVESMIAGTVGFALASGIEFLFRRKPLLAITSSLVLVSFAYSIYRMGSAGAFS